MKRKMFEIGDDVAAQFEGFCAQRGLVEKRVIESMMLYFMAQDPETREEILMSGAEGAGDKPPLRVAAKPAAGVKYTRKRDPKA